MRDQASFHRPRSGRLPAAQAYSGFGRSALYEMAAKYPGLFKKNGAATIVDFDVLDAVIATLPVAAISPPKPRVLPPFPEKRQRVAE
jgi:hypothetical protein